MGSNAEQLKAASAMLEGKKRILLVGSPGAGKTTLARELGSAMNLPVVHLDQHFWKPGWIPSTLEEWGTKLTDLLEAPSWIMDGDYNRTLDVRIRRADLVLFLDLPPWLCRLRTLRRVALGFGRTRPDLAQGCPEQLDFDFLRWVWAWPQDIRPRVLRSLERAPNGVRVVTLAASREVDEFRDHIPRHPSR